MRKITITIPVTIHLNVDDGQSLREVVEDLNFTVEPTDLTSYNVGNVEWSPDSTEVVDSR